MRATHVTIDGNEAAACIAHLTNEVVAIYPITPASPMGEWADEWSSNGVKNLWGLVPQVIEMQSEAGAERVLVLMGSGLGAAEEAVDTLCRRGEKVGLIKVRLFRPFSPDHLLEALPTSVLSLAVLDRTKERGSDGEPLYKDVLCALAQAVAHGRRQSMPLVIGGRFGLSSQEFTLGMAASVFDELKKSSPENHFTIGNEDDVSHCSLEGDRSFAPDAAEGITRCLFYGLGSDGTGSANKNSIKIISEQTALHVQGYFQYDSKKVGAVTVSHLRFGERPIRSTYLIGEDEAQFVACHQPNFLTRYDMLAKAAPGGAFLLNSPLAADRGWGSLPRPVQAQIRDRCLPSRAADRWGAMIMQPLFEFSSACVGCGETPYIKLATQLFGDRMLIANATGCSSIYGGNLPTTPYTKNPDGRGLAWNNSLFEDNVEFGLGLRVALDTQVGHARELLRELNGEIGGSLVEAILSAEQKEEAGIHEQRRRVAELKARLAGISSPTAGMLAGIADLLVRKSVWLIGGDGWAYDIGYGGVDHVLASGRDVNILVLDTEVYSNTGGQTSKATPLGAVAKFSAGGKPVVKKDLAMMAMAYGDVYVVQVGCGAKDVQVLRAFLEAETCDGPSLIVAYCPCIAHGIEPSNNHRQQTLAVGAVHWGLFRYDPRRASRGDNPLRLDSKEPTIPYRDFAASETRFSVLERTHPEAAHYFLQQAQQRIRHRFHLYEQLATLAAGDPQP